MFLSHYIEVAMPYFDEKLIYSSTASSFTTLLFFAVSALGDRFINPSDATLIGAVISTVSNMLLQYHILYPRNKKFSSALYYKYPTGHIVDISVTYFACRYFFERRERFIVMLPERLRPYFNTIVRFFVMIVHFFLVAYPVRRYWIFT